MTQEKDGGGNIKKKNQTIVLANDRWGSVCCANVQYSTGYTVCFLQNIL